MTTRAGPTVRVHAHTNKNSHLRGFDNRDPAEKTSRQNGDHDSVCGTADIEG